MLEMYAIERGENYMLTQLQADGRILSSATHEYNCWSLWVYSPSVV